VVEVELDGSCIFVRALLFFSLGFGGKNIPTILNLLKLRRKIGKTSAEVHALKFYP
jgi:hypothetical protein